MREITENGKIYIVSDNYPNPPYVKFLKPDPSAAAKERIKEELKLIADSDLQLFRMVLAVNDMAVSKGLWANNEFPKDIMDMVAEVKQKLRMIDAT